MDGTNTPRQRANYYRDYRAKATDEKRKQWSQERTNRAKRSKEKEAKNKVREKKSAENKRAYNKRVSKNTVLLPNTPNSKAKTIANLVDSATPTTSQALAENHGIKRSRERTAECAITEATSSVVKSDKGIRKRLLPELTNANKKAVSERLNINRSHFYYKSQRGRNPKISRDVIVSVVDFYRRSDIQITYPNKTKNGQPMLVLKYSRKRTYHMFLEENPGCTTSKTTFDKLKPKALKLLKHAKWLQCICRVCDNISMVCRAIRLSMYRSNMEVPTQLNSELE